MIRYFKIEYDTWFDIENSPKSPLFLMGGKEGGFFHPVNF